MPTPLPDPLASVLRSDSTAALAALMVIAGAHRDLFAWAARMVCAKSPASEPKPNGDGEQPRRARKARAFRTKQHTDIKSLARPLKNEDRLQGNAAYHARRREARALDDQALLEAMRTSPAATIGDWAEFIGKSKTSTNAGLSRLRDAGLAVSSEGHWKLTEEPPPREPPPKWVAPLRGTDRAAHPHITA